MSSSSLSLIVFVDSEAARRWRAPILEAAGKSGRSIIDGPAPAALDEFLDDTVIISDDVNWLVLVPPKDAHLIATGLVPSGKSGPMTLHEKALWLVDSGRLAVACHVLKLGGKLHEGRNEIIELAGLGHISASSPLMPTHVRDSPLAMYVTLPPEVGSSAIWPGECFWYPTGVASDGGDPLVDLTGRSRAIVHGPYLHLTPGRWRATAEFEIDPEGLHADLRMEWGSDGDFSVAYFMISEPGVYAVEIEHDWVGPGAAQLIVWINKPLFRGRFRLSKVKVESVA